MLKIIKNKKIYTFFVDSVVLCMFLIIYEMVFDNNYIYTMYKEIEKTLW